MALAAKNSLLLFFGLRSLAGPSAQAAGGSQEQTASV